ncbi:MAG: DUF928 domain-containing protein [Cyanobacteriota bacterium]|nr:DUF928 domain-containing protein [Cyanobacteriota bacterium]
MKNATLNSRQQQFGVLVTTTALLIAPVSFSAIAQSFPTTSVSLTFPTGDGRGAPGRTLGIGSRREGCIDPSSAISLTALTPTNNIVKTVAGNPSIYVYVPAVKGKEAIFRVIDKEAEDILYQTTVSLDSLPGIFKLSLPETVQLRSNVTYEWGFFIQCDPNNPLADEGIEGWLERAELTPEQEREIQQAAENPLEQAQLYAEAGVWNETLAIAVRVRNSHPTAWAELLESVGLAPEIAESPMIQ